MSEKVALMYNHTGNPILITVASIIGLRRGTSIPIRVKRAQKNHIETGDYQLARVTTYDRKSMKSIRVILVIAMHVMALNVWADSSHSHFGFQFGTSYDDCLSLIRKIYGRKVRIKQSLYKERESRIEIPILVFNKDFNEYKSKNILYFTPRTKRLYQIEHVIPLKGDEVLNRIWELQNALDAKYGLTRPDALVSNFSIFAHSQRWSNKEIQIHLYTIAYGLVIPKDIYLSYSHINFSKIKSDEMQELEMPLNKDL